MRGGLCQRLTTLSLKDFFLISNLNIPSFSSKPFPLVLSQQTLLKNLFPSFLQPLWILTGCSQVSQSLPFSMLHTPALSLSSQGAVPSLIIFVALLQQLHVLSCADHSPSERRAPGEVSQCRAEGRSSPSPYWLCCFGCSQDPVGFLSCKGTVLVHVQLPSTITPRSFSAGLCSILISPSPSLS